MVESGLEPFGDDPFGETAAFGVEAGLVKSVVDRDGILDTTLAGDRVDGDLFIAVVVGETEEVCLSLLELFPVDCKLIHKWRRLCLRTTPLLTSLAVLTLGGWCISVLCRVIAFSSSFAHFQQK